MQLCFLKSVYSVCQLPGDAELPPWASAFLSVTRTPEELTVIIESSEVPDDTKAQHEFACFRVAEQLSFDEIGIIARISGCLAEKKIPILSISTYDTDYFLIPNRQKKEVMAILVRAGYQFLNQT